MLAKPAPLDYLALPYPIAAEIKWDGVRCVCIVFNGKATLYSRNGKLFNNFDEIAQSMRGKPEGVYDGEIISPDGFQALMTRTNATRGTNTEVKLEYKIFDSLTINESMNGESKRTYQSRCVNASIGERTIVKNHVELELYYNFMVKAGHEGLILKELTGMYNVDKSTWYKLKPKDTIDMTILGFDEGTGDNEGSLGAIQCQGNAQGFNVFSYVGVGFTKEQRKDIWTRKKELNKATVEIEFQELTKPDKYGHCSLRSPSFKCLRMDK